MKRDRVESAPVPASASGPAPAAAIAAASLEDLVGRGKYVDAFRAYQEMDETVRAEAEVELQAARAASFLGDLDSARSLVESALEGYESRQDELGRISAVNVRGAIAFERGQYANAATAFREVFEVAVRKEDYRLIARSLNNLASIASVEGRSALAVNYYRSALLAYRRLRDYRGQAETFCNLGIVHRQAMEFEEAESAFEDAVYHSGLDGDPYLLALAWTGRAELHLERAALTEAASDLARADEMATLAGDEIGRTEIGRIRALLALARDEPVKAHAHAGEIRERARRRGLRLIESECCAISACALKRLGDLREAESFRAKATAGLRALGARTLLERFERDWEAA
ncbi:MAG: tetratricopeptide repeat protein [Gemmatimonadota bacterium]